MTADTLEQEGFSAIESLLQEWETTYLSGSSETKWIYFTKLVSTTSEGPQTLRFTTVFSQPTQSQPVPKATAAVHFLFNDSKRLSWQFEANKTVHTSDTATLLGNPAKRLTEIVKSKEAMAKRFATQLDGVTAEI